MKKRWITLAIVLAAGLFLTSFHRDDAERLPPEVIARSRFSDGNPARLDRVMLKARRGEPVTIGFIGGSITWGQGASKPELSYAYRLTQWWRQAFPASNISYINAGIRGTSSAVGCLRVQQDLLSHHPDFVIVEFGVNDKADLARAETYEGVIRQILAAPNQPAVVELFTMHHDGANAQEFQGEIGKQYQLPMISFRDALWPLMQAGRFKWSDVFADVIHPNDRGHADIALFIESFLNDALRQLPKEAPPIPPLPPPRYTNVFATATVVPAVQLTPIFNRGWAFDPSTKTWNSDNPGSAIEFDFAGPLIELMYADVGPLGGVAQVSVDGQPPVRCDAWFDGSWDAYAKVDVAARNLSPGPHRVWIKLTSEQNMYSKGHQFRIVGLVRAGI